LAGKDETLSVPTAGGDGAGMGAKNAPHLEIAAWRYFGWFDIWPNTVRVGFEVQTDGDKTIVIEGNNAKLIQAEWKPRMGMGMSGPSSPSRRRWIGCWRG